MQKEKNFRFLIVIFSFAFFILIFHSVSAYHFLEPLPGLGEKVETDVLAKYLSWLFRFALAAAAFLAVLQITIGGIQMIFGGASETARTNAKQRISDAIWGLVLALGSVLILTTVSTQFKDMKLTIPEIKVKVTKAPTEPTKEIYHCFITYKNIIGIEHTSKVGGNFNKLEDCNSYCEFAECGGSDSKCTKTGWKCNLI